MFYTIQSIEPIAKRIRDSGKNIVLATGFFDLLHSEHINFLGKAKASGDVLIVAVESDLRAKQTKGDDRPIDTQSVRCQNVLKHSDYVVALPDDFDNFEAYDSLMAAVQPLVYAVSSNTTHQKTKNFLVEKYGGKLKVVHEFNPEISTTQIINNGIMT